jgi:hypothetical protein
VATEFGPGNRIDGYSVRLVRWAAKDGVRAVRDALKRGQMPSKRDFDCSYWDFGGEWRPYAEGKAPAEYVPGGAFLDPTLNLLRDIEDPTAVRVLAKIIEEARDAAKVP